MKVYFPSLHLARPAAQPDTIFLFLNPFFSIFFTERLGRCVWTWNRSAIDASRCTDIHTTSPPTPLQCRLVTRKCVSSVAFAAHWTSSTFAFLRPSVGSPLPFFVLLIPILERLYYNDFPVMWAAIKWMVKDALMVFLIGKWWHAWKLTLFANKHVHTGHFLTRILLTPETSPITSMVEKYGVQKTASSVEWKLENIFWCELQSQSKSRYHKMNKCARS